MATKKNGKPKTSGKKNMKKTKAKQKTKRLILFIVEILVLLVMVSVLWGGLNNQKISRYDIKKKESVLK